ncbi:MAG TPA: gamma-glutamylcyclotransferase [Leptolyngbyaceae cyanobacterium M33_DOE_097]|uniref:Gamma-glutamylcyclotransferase n=1 Tax=Oscillatoriales cyanobacterium SpSt-418 TaxID=2282169 RepID=A0A7C3KBM6_9CYAN|nr:gamma-glutamylcyclotransferase [Leptolyngbyaceae cyanobacterium M33_DOE_097]
MSQPEASTRRIFICGSALRGQPDHGNLGNAQFIRTAKTQAIYRLHAAENGWHPAIYQVEENGISIPGEVYEISIAEFDHLAANEPPHMYPSDVVLEDGEVLTAFLYPRELVEQYNWEDISHLGGWAAYKASIAQAAQ